MDSSSLVSSQIPRAARGLRVLLVDHDTPSLMYVASVLEEQHYKVRTTELATVALSMIQEEEHQFDLVVADTNMPEMDVFTFLKCILLKRDIPIILMSFGASEDMARKALSEGACFFLEKPIRTQDLINVWQHVYRRRRALQGMEIQREATAEILAISRREVSDIGISQVNATKDLRNVSGWNKQTTGEINLIERDCTRESAGISEERLITVESERIHQENTQENFFIGSEIEKMDSFLKENFEYEASASRAAAGSDKDGTNDEHLPTAKGEKDIAIEGEVGQEKGIPVRESQNNSTECLISVAKEEQGDQLKRKGLADQDGERVEGRSQLKEHDSKATEPNKEARRKTKERDVNSFDKRSRMTWTSKLHLKFMEAISVLGEKKAHPKAVLEMMNVPNLTHRHVASHLQKYRERVKRISDGHATNPPLLQSKMTGSTFKFYSGNGIPQKQAGLHNSGKSPEGTLTAKPVLLEAAMKQYSPEIPLGRPRLCLGSSFPLTNADLSNKLTQNSPTHHASDFHKPLVDSNGKLHRLDWVEGSTASADTIDQTANSKGERPLGLGHVTTSLACPGNSAHTCRALDCTQHLNAPHIWQNISQFVSGQEQSAIAGIATPSCMLDLIHYADLEAELAGFKGQLNNGDIDHFSEWLVTPPKSEAAFPDHQLNRSHSNNTQ